MAHLIVKYPNSREKFVPPDKGFFFPKKHLNLARTAVGDWIIWYLPKRAGLSTVGVYYAIALAGDISTDLDRPGFYFMTLSRFEKLESSLQAVSRQVIYEEGLAKLGRKSREQQRIRSLSDQEFVNILEDCVSQTDSQHHFSPTLHAYEEHKRRMALFIDLANSSRERIRNTYPL